MSKYVNIKAFSTDHIFQKYKFISFYHSESVSDVVSDSFSSFMEKLFPSPDKETEPFAVSHIGDALPKYKPLIIEKSPSFGEQTAILESSVHSLPPAVPKPERKVKGKCN